MLDRIKESGTVHFGFREDAAPLSYRGPDGQPAGYSVLICDAVAERLAKQLGTAELTVEWQPVTTTDRFDAVAEGRIDLLCGAASDHAFPAGAGGLLAADLRRRRGGAAAARMPTRTSTRSRDKKIGVQAGTSTEETLRNTLKAKAMPADVVTFEDHDAGLAALEAREIDAYFGDQSILFGLFFESDLSEELAVSENTLTIEKQGLALARGDSDFRLAVDRAVSDLYVSGKMTEFFKAAFPGASPGVALRALFLLGPDMP